jgi:serine-type D-Ala-D-Ala carboxypeptidase/endopeptidase
VQESTAAHGYVGRYRFSPAVVLTITRDGNALFVQENDEPKQELELGAESENRFFSKTADDEYSFEIDSSGHVTGMVLHTDGKDLPMKRVE